MLAGETIQLQCHSIVNYINIHARDKVVYTKYSDTIPGTYVVFFVFMDTAMGVGGVWVIRPLREPEL